KTGRGTEMRGVLDQPQFPGLQKVLDVLLTLLGDRSNRPKVVVFDQTHDLVMKWAPERSDDFESPDGAYHMAGMGGRDVHAPRTGQRSVIWVYVKNLAGVVHELVEHAIAPTLAHGSKGGSMAKRWHTIGFFLEGIADGVVMP